MNVGGGGPDRSAGPSISTSHSQFSSPHCTPSHSPPSHFLIFTSQCFKYLPSYFSFRLCLPSLHPRVSFSLALSLLPSLALTIPQFAYLHLLVFSPSPFPSFPSSSNPPFHFHSSTPKMTSRRERSLSRKRCRGEEQRDSGVLHVKRVSRTSERLSLQGPRRPGGRRACGLGALQAHFLSCKPEQNSSPEQWMLRTYSAGGVSES